MHQVHPAPLTLLRQISTVQYEKFRISPTYDFESKDAVLQREKADSNTAQSFYAPPPAFPSAALLRPVPPHPLEAAGVTHSGQVAVEMETVKGAGGCLVCSDAAAEVVLMQCGHGGLCEGAALLRRRSYSQCP